MFIISEGNSNEKNYKFLDDEPLENLEGDRFKTHSKIAGSIKKVLDNKENESHTIALKGKYGSGKTSVINILKEECSKEKNNEIHFFIFDAWEFGVSYLQHIFLYKFVDWIDSNYNEIFNKGKKDTEQKKSGKDTEQKKSGKDAEQMKSEKDTEQKKSGKDAEQIKSGKDTGQMKSEKDTEQMKSEKDTEQIKSGKDTGQKKSGKDTGQMKSEKDTEQMKSGKDAEQMKSGKDAEQIKSGKDAEQIKSERLDFKNIKNAIVGKTKSVDRDTSYKNTESIKWIVYFALLLIIIPSMIPIFTSSINLVLKFTIFEFVIFSFFYLGFFIRNKSEKNRDDSPTTQNKNKIMEKIKTYINKIPSIALLNVLMFFLPIIFYYNFSEISESIYLSDLLNVILNAINVISIMFLFFCIYISKSRDKEKKKRMPNNKNNSKYEKTLNILFISSLIIGVISFLIFFVGANSKNILGLVSFIFVYCALAFLKIKNFSINDELIEKMALIYSGFSVGTIKDTISETTLINNPIEFQNKFKEILESICKENVRIVIVIDNLDRIQPAKAKDFLSTIKPFLIRNNKIIAKDIIKKIWYIVPFSEENFLIDSKKENMPDEINNDKNEIKKDKSNLEALNKLFDIQFRIGEIIDTKWENFLKEKINKTDLSINDLDFLKIIEAIKLVKKYISRNKKDYNNKKKTVCNYRNIFPSPREIVHYINNILSAKISQNDDFDIFYTAIYAAFSLYDISLDEADGFLAQNCDHLNRFNFFDEEIFCMAMVAINNCETIKKTKLLPYSIELEEMIKNGEIISEDKYKNIDKDDILFILKKLFLKICSTEYNEIPYNLFLGLRTLFSIESISKEEKEDLLKIINVDDILNKIDDLHNLYRDEEASKKYIEGMNELILFNPDYKEKISLKINESLSNDFKENDVSVKDKIYVSNFIYYLSKYYKGNLEEINEVKFSGEEQENFDDLIYDNNIIKKQQKKFLSKYYVKKEIYIKESSDIVDNKFTKKLLIYKKINILIIDDIKCSINILNDPNRKINSIFRDCYSKPIIEFYNKIKNLIVLLLIIKSFENDNSLKINNVGKYLNYFFSNYDKGFTGISDNDKLELEIYLVALLSTSNINNSTLKNYDIACKNGIEKLKSNVKKHGEIAFVKRVNDVLEDYNLKKYVIDKLDFLLNM